MNRAYRGKPRQRAGGFSLAFLAPSGTTQTDRTPSHSVARGSFFLRRFLMRHAIVLSLSICLFVTSAARADDQVDGKALVDKAIKAMGGEAKLAKYKAMNTKGKGTIFTPGEVVFTEESWWQPPGQYRFDMELDLAGTKVRQVFVFDGEKGWIKLGD